MLQNFRYRLQTEPGFRQGVFIGLFILLLSVFLGVGYYLNFVLPNSGSAQQQSLTQETQQEETIEPIRFDTSGDLELALDIPELAGNRVRQFQRDYVYITANFDFGYNDTIYVNYEENLFPQTMYQSPEGIILNETRNTTIFNPGDETFSQIQNNYSIVPVLNREANITEYYSLDTSGFAGRIMRSFSLSSVDQSSEITTFNLDSDVSSYELRSIAGNLYLISYEGLLRDGDINIFLIENRSLTLVAAPANVETIIFGGNHVLYETQILGSDEFVYTAIDFSSDETGQRTLIDLPNLLAADGITGVALLQRCTLTEINHLNCLVKESSTDFTNSGENDVIARINLQDNTFARSYPNAFISAQSIYFNDSGELHVISQGDGKLYKFGL
jgi:hypothetical protein